MNKLAITISALAVGLSTNAVAAKTISGAYVGCVTKDALDEFITAAVNEDYRQIQALSGSVCVPIEGREFSVVDAGWAKSQIRVYVDGGSLLLWTVSEATK